MVIIVLNEYLVFERKIYEFVYKSVKLVRYTLILMPEVNGA